jgi:hypothetical protein
MGDIVGERSSSSGFIAQTGLFHLNNLGAQVG